MLARFEELITCLRKLEHLLFRCLLGSLGSRGGALVARARWRPTVDRRIRGMLILIWGLVVLGEHRLHRGVPEFHHCAFWGGTVARTLVVVVEAAWCETCEEHFQVSLAAIRLRVRGWLQRNYLHPFTVDVLGLYGYARVTWGPIVVLFYFYAELSRH
jgi:hypothetical protein